MREDKTRLSYWFPLIEAAGLPVPATRIVRLTDDEVGEMYRLFDGEDAPACFERLVHEIRAAATTVGGYPFFLRTDFTSGKHDWKNTCFVADPARIGSHVYALAEFSEMADMFGGMPFDTWVVREFLPTVPLFYAFSGHMPITMEFRFFVRDDEIEHVQPYWPADSIDGHHPSRENWRELLAMVSNVSAANGQLSDLARKASRSVPGYWSVDFLMTSTRGWILTDMAEGDKSFRWEP